MYVTSTKERKSDVLASENIIQAVFMTAFFLLSGFSLFVNHAGSNIIESKSLKRFWLKRFINIMPMYYLVGLIYEIFSLDNAPIWQRILIAPVEILGIQSEFDGLFGVSHNGGTWFVSCIIVCYFAYPFIQEIVKRMTVRTKKISVLICVFILLYAPFVEKAFNTGYIYPNPFFRLLEFYIGVVLASSKLDLRERTQGFFYNWYTIIITTIVMISGVTVAVTIGIDGGYMLYNWICLPCFAIILLGLSGVKFNYKESKVLKVLCGASYGSSGVPVGKIRGRNAR